MYEQSSQEKIKYKVWGIDPEKYITYYLINTDISGYADPIIEIFDDLTKEKISNKQDFQLENKQLLITILKLENLITEFIGNRVKDDIMTIPMEREFLDQKLILNVRDRVDSKILWYIDILSLMQYSIDHKATFNSSFLES